MSHRWLSILMVAGLASPALGTPLHENLAVNPITKDSFGTTQGGQAVERFTLTNRLGHVAALITYGATLTELKVPDRDGELGDVVLGFDDLASYESRSPYFGCTTGRVANRIAYGKFELEGKSYQLATNNDAHHLHGGNKGLDKVVWKAKPFEREDGPAVLFTYVSPAGEEGYPGQLSLAVTYVLTHAGELRIEYAATTDAATPVNLTHHSYFNLSAGTADTIGDHVLTVSAQHYTPGDDTLIPTGEIASVAGTPFDFTVPMTIGSRLARVRGGYDLNYVLDGSSELLSHAATVVDPSSGRCMEILTTEPGLQFYTGNFLDDVADKGGRVYPQHGAFCLEAQHFPDSINKPEFPSVVLRPGETYRQITVHRFSAH